MAIVLQSGCLCVCVCCPACCEAALIGHPFLGKGSGPLFCKWDQLLDIQAYQFMCLHLHVFYLPAMPGL